MKLGLGLYRDILTIDNFKFTRQTGATHVVVHLVRNFQGDNPSLSRGDDTTGWGISKDDDDVWSYESLVRLKKEIESHGLTWEAIENFNPAHWHDVLLNGPKKQKQLDYLKQIIRNVGKAGIPVIGYNFSIAGVWGWTKGPVGRGEAVSVKFNADEIDLQKPIPKGMVWNMAYNAKKKTND